MPKLSPGFRLREGAKKILWPSAAHESPHFKIYFFSQSVYVFHYILLLPKMHNTIMFSVLFHCIVIIWMTKSANQLNYIAKAFKMVYLRGAAGIFWYMLPVPPRFPSISSKFIVPPPNSIAPSTEKKVIHN